MAWLRGILKTATREDSLPTGPLKKLTAILWEGYMARSCKAASRNSELTAATMKTRLQLYNGKNWILPTTVWAWNGISSSMKEHRLADIFIIVFTKNGVAYKFVTLLNVSVGYNVRANCSKIVVSIYWVPLGSSLSSIGFNIPVFTVRVGWLDLQGFSSSDSFMWGILLCTIKMTISPWESQWSLCTFAEVP